MGRARELRRARARRRDRGRARPRTAGRSTRAEGPGARRRRAPRDRATRRARLGSGELARRRKEVAVPTVDEVRALKREAHVELRSKRWGPAQRVDHALVRGELEGILVAAKVAMPEACPRTARDRELVHVPVARPRVRRVREHARLDRGGRRRSACAEVTILGERARKIGEEDHDEQRRRRHRREPARARVHGRDVGDAPRRESGERGAEPRLVAVRQAKVPKARHHVERDSKERRRVAEREQHRDDDGREKEETQRRA